MASSLGAIDPFAKGGDWQKNMRQRKKEAEQLEAELGGIPEEMDVVRRDNKGMHILTNEKDFEQFIFFSGFSKHELFNTLQIVFFYNRHAVQNDSQHKGFLQLKTNLDVYKGKMDLAIMTKYMKRDLGVSLPVFVIYCNHTEVARYAGLNTGFLDAIYRHTHRCFLQYIKRYDRFMAIVNEKKRKAKEAKEAKEAARRQAFYRALEERYEKERVARAEALGIEVTIRKRQPVEEVKEEVVEEPKIPWEEFEMDIDQAYDMDLRCAYTPWTED